jgi:hypothetical protein
MHENEEKTEDITAALEKMGIQDRGEEQEEETKATLPSNKKKSKKKKQGTTEGVAYNLRSRIKDF